MFNGQVQFLFLSLSCCIHCFSMFLLFLNRRHIYQRMYYFSINIEKVFRIVSCLAKFGSSPRNSVHGNKIITRHSIPQWRELKTAIFTLLTVHAILGSMSFLSEFSLFTVLFCLELWSKVVPIGTLVV